MDKIAIVAIAYNRTDSLSRLLHSLDKGHYDSEDVPLIISIDKSNTDEVENYADKYNWAHGSKTIVKHKENLGLRKHIMSQGHLLNDYDAIILLEDDLVVAADFWSYAKQTVAAYKDSDEVAGISLYSFGVNYQTDYPFLPEKDGHDVYLMNCAMSWGQIWMKRQWMEFKEWYDANISFSQSSEIPQTLYKWGEKSWLKYYTRYCIENNKYFVFPYTSFTTNFSPVGTHSTNERHTFQVVLQSDRIGVLRLPYSSDDAICYDGFFENKKLYSCLGLSPSECSLDLAESNGNISHKRYWLTTRKENYRILKAYGCVYRPMEKNVEENVPGNDIFLYDTSTHENNRHSSGNATYLHRYNIVYGLIFLKHYGLKNLVHDFIKIMKQQ